MPSNPAGQAAYFLRLKPDNDEGPESLVADCLARDYVAIGWDLRKVRKNATKDALRAHLEKIYPYYEPSRIPHAIAVLYPFLQMKKGDLVLCPATDGSRDFYVATILTDEITFRPGHAGMNQRAVRWLNDRKRWAFAKAPPALQSRMKAQQTCLDISVLLPDILSLLSVPSSQTRASKDAGGSKDADADDFRSPDDIVDPDREFPEGAKKTITVNRYERSREARDACIRHFRKLRGNRTICEACEFDFAKDYGELGAGYIHVHHTKPLESLGKAYKVNPTKDLVPVCPNCHAMLHRKDPPLAIEALQKLLDRRRKLG